MKSSKKIFQLKTWVFFVDLWSVDKVREEQCRAGKSREDKGRTRKGREG
jgi:hypothetical protein